MSRAALITTRARHTTHALVIHVEQIMDGHMVCDYCWRDSIALIGTGADPVAKPHCAEHAAVMMHSAAQVIRSFGGEDESPLSGSAA